MVTVTHIGGGTEVPIHVEAEHSMYTLLKDAFFKLELLTFNARKGRRDGLFENQRSNVGKAHGIAGEGRTLSKNLIRGLRAGRRLSKEERQSMQDAMVGKMVDLSKIVLPGDMALLKVQDLPDWNGKPGIIKIPGETSARFRKQLGPEIVEAYFTDVQWSAVGLDEDLPEKLLLPTDFRVSVQEWLSAIPESVSEVSKLVWNELTVLDFEQEDVIEEAIALRAGFIWNAQKVYDALEEFETVAPNVINITSRPFRFTFRGMIQSLDFILEEHTKAQAGVLLQQASNRIQLSKIETLLQTFKSANA